MRSSVEFSYRLVGTGWSEGRFAIGKSWAEITASYLSDALGALLGALHELTVGAETAHASWDEEPGEHRWVFTRDGDGVRVRILEFDELLSDSPDEEGKTLLDGHCQLDALVAAVAAGAPAVIEEHGEDGYVAKWIEHRFPTQALLALEEWVSSR